MPETADPALAMSDLVSDHGATAVEREGSEHTLDHKDFDRSFHMVLLFVYEPCLKVHPMMDE